MADGFLGRWSRRKLDAKDGRPLPEPTAQPPVPTAAPRTDAGPAPAGSAAATGTNPVAPLGAAQPSAVPSATTASDTPLTLDDVNALTPTSDFRPFVGRAVEPDVRNAAMKKLFTDPHYNVMDGLDIYIDDYSVPSPLPESVLRQMASAQFLRLFEDDANAQDAQAHTRDNAGPATAPPTPISADTASPHEDPDLRLQQDHAPGPQGPGRGAE